MPTIGYVSHSGMCCALNAGKELQNSTYSRLVEEMQGPGEKRRVPASAGKKDGLTLVLDLHSNQAALGTVDNNYDAFNIFIGKVSKTTRNKNKTKKTFRKYEAIFSKSFYSSRYTQTK